jgi:hypothetical protein
MSLAETVLKAKSLLGQQTGSALVDELAEALVELHAQRDAYRYLARERERERDSHRRTLNHIADRLHVVHEDPKILAAFEGLVDVRQALMTACKRHKDALTTLVEAIDGKGSLQQALKTANDVLTKIFGTARLGEGFVWAPHAPTKDTK